MPTREYHNDYYRSHPKRRADIRRYKKASMERARVFVDDYLASHSCIKCGEPDVVVLEFDHRDPSSKIKDVSKMIQDGNSLIKIAAEIVKCDVLCANCHRRKTVAQFGWK